MQFLVASFRDRAKAKNEWFPVVGILKAFGE